MRLPRRAATTIAGTLLTATALAAQAGSPGASALAATSQLDTSFGAGYETIDLRGTPDVATGVAIDASGRIVLGATSFRPGLTLSDPGFIRLTTSGAVETTFAGTNDRAFVLLPESTTLLDFALASGEKIVGLAESNTHKEYLFRLNADGTLDTASDSDPTSHFGTNGVLTLTPSATAFADEAIKVAVAPDDSIIIAGGFAEHQADPREVRVRGFTATGGFLFDTGVNLGTGSSFVDSLVISPSGDRALVLASSTNTSGKSAVGLFAFDTAGGDPDPSFSGDGLLVLGSSLHPTLARDAAFRFDGFLYIAALDGAASGSAITDALIMRLDTTGALDGTFSGDGKATSSAPGFDSIQSVFATPTGRVVAVGKHLDPDLLAMRMKSDGALDTGFDGDGALRLLPPADFRPFAAVPATNGRTVVVGDISGPDSAALDLGVIRLTSSGAGDPTLSDGTLRRYPMSARLDESLAVAVAPDGVIVAGSHSDQAFVAQAELLKVRSDGYRDPTFGDVGRAFIVAGGFDDTEARAVGMSGAKPVFAGCRDCAADDSTFLVGRLTKTGHLDGGFSGDGVATTGFGAVDAEADGLAIQADGKVIAVGSAGGDFAVARYTASGAPDPDFSGDGNLTTDITAGSTDAAADVAVQSDGKIVVVGRRVDVNGVRFAVARYKPGGGLDTSFSGDGIVVTNVGQSAEASSVAIRPDGRIVVVGNTEGTRKVTVVRYLPDGTLDDSLDGDGKLVRTLSSGNEDALDVAAVGNKMVIAGGGGTTSGNLFVARLLGDGTPDPTFSGDGVEAFTEFPTLARSIAIAGDGSIVVAGKSGLPSSSTSIDTLVARFRP